MNLDRELPVDRREFLAASAATTAAALSPLPRLDAIDRSSPRQYIELRRYHLLPGAKQRAFTAFVGDVAIPAMNRAGVVRVGAFGVVYGENAPSLLMVLAHDTLAGDAAYSRAGAAILDAPMDDPAFVRVESSLLRAFDAIPTVEAPRKAAAAAAGAAAARILELRTYESHSDRAALNKLAMFNAGEIPIFRRTGLTPVFFGETIVGAKMPSLTYMLTFRDMVARDAAWATFSRDAAWKTLSTDSQYQDNVSAITDVILRPMSYSQL